MISERISDDILPQMNILNMVISILMHFCSFYLKLERCKPHKVASHPTKCEVFNNFKLFPTVYRRIYCRKFLTLSNQTSCYKINCIRMPLIYLCILPLAPLCILVMRYVQCSSHKMCMCIIIMGLNMQICLPGFRPCYAKSSLLRYRLI